MRITRNLTNIFGFKSELRYVDLVKQNNMFEHVYYSNSIHIFKVKWNGKKITILRLNEDVVYLIQNISDIHSGYKFIKDKYVNCVRFKNNEEYVDIICDSRDVMKISKVLQGMRRIRNQ